MIPDRLLMGAGPSNPYPEAMAALGRPLLGNLDPDFLDLCAETCARLQQVFRTTNPLTFPVGGTGSGAMEAALANVVAPGDVVVVGVNGAFGERTCEVATVCGADIVRVEAPWGEPLHTEQLLAAHPHPTVIAVAHAETSSGVANDLDGLGAAKGDALLVVDCVTSLCGMPLAVDDAEIDIAFSATQKCLGAPPGLGPVTFSPRAYERFIDQPRTWFHDVRHVARAHLDDPRAPLFRQTANIPGMFALHAALGVVLEEGLDHVIARHADAGRRLQEGLAKLGLDSLARPEYQLAQLTAVVVPEGVDAHAVRHRLREEFAIEISPGLGPTRDTLWRFGVMGHNARTGPVTLLLSALAEVLGR
jgi:alanine-glyoxylate transaminase/serine-glyoxylate transaminase/serine-pyruvate transaminase